MPRSHIFIFQFIHLIALNDYNNALRDPMSIRMTTKTTNEDELQHPFECRAQPRRLHLSEQRCYEQPRARARLCVCENDSDQEYRTSEEER